MPSYNQKQKMIQNYSLLAIESLCIIVSYLTALVVRHKGFEAIPKLDFYMTTLLALLFFHLLAYFLFDWNEAIFKRGYYTEFIAIFKYNICLVVLFSTYLFMTKTAYIFSRLSFFYFFIFNILLTYLTHLAFKHFLTSTYRSSINSNKVMLITTSKYAESILNKINDANEWSFQITSICIMDKNQTGSFIQGIPVIADSTSLLEKSKQIILDDVFIHLPAYAASEIENLISGFEFMGITVHLNVDVYNLNITQKKAGSFAGFTVLSFSTQIFDYRRLLIKRIIDIIGALIGLIITIIITPFISIAIKLESPGPIFFSQKRVGKNGRYFKIYKFRSMYLDAEERKAELMKKNEINGLMFKMTDDPRITKVGKFIRKTSIDELPQFFNILIGDMSLVGTRPPTIDEFKQYNLHYRRRLSITPGLTGMWQVSGRSDIKDFEEVVKLDLEYIDHWSLGLDFKILVQTVKVVLFGKGSK